MTPLTFTCKGEHFCWMLSFLCINTWEALQHFAYAPWANWTTQKATGTLAFTNACPHDSTWRKHVSFFNNFKQRVSNRCHSDGPCCLITLPCVETPTWNFPWTKEFVRVAEFFELWIICGKRMLIDDTCSFSFYSTSSSPEKEIWSSNRLGTPLDGGWEARRAFGPSTHYRGHLFELRSWGFQLQCSNYGVSSYGIIRIMGFRVVEFPLYFTIWNGRFYLLTVISNFCLTLIK